MKILGLDLGDKWIGVAISDGLGISCRPLATVTIEELQEFLVDLLQKENIKTIVVGHPITMKGTESAQTIETMRVKDNLEISLSKQGIRPKWVLWDERLSSKRAQIRKATSKEERKTEHAIAASFILQSYLDAEAIKANK